VPSEHTTVVVEFWGTTIVVLAGAGGLLLLMQPDSSMGITTIKLVNIFIGISSVRELVAPSPCDGRDDDFE
jgi:hypothetical protein